MSSDARLPRASVLFPFRAWLAHPLLRAWPTWVFVALVAAPPFGLALAGSSSDTEVTVTVFAVYFAIAWFLVLWLVVRPQRLDGALLAQVVALAVVIVGPLALALEQAFEGDTAHLLQSTLAVGLPEELAKLVPVAIVALMHRRIGLTPRDMLFLGAVSGLVFGAVEAVRYGTVYAPPLLTWDTALVVVWRFVTDPIAHACWAGIAGYFLGLAVYYRRPQHVVALVAIGLGVPSVLHGLNDWDAVNGGMAWVLVTVVSTVLFLGYARVGLAASPAVGAARTRLTVPAADPVTEPIRLPGLVGSH